MKILVLWDVYGRLWRKVLKSELPKLQKKYWPDFTIVNIENCTSWRGPIIEHAREIQKLWVDCMTSWDHIYDQKDNIKEILCQENISIIRPANFIESSWNPGVWYVIIQKGGMRLLVIQLIWEVFMNHKVDNPFLKLESIIENIPKSSYDVSIVDFHRETTAEIYGLWKYFDGRVWLIFWTHTHIQTADAHVMNWWTWIISDVWMNGPHDSIIGADPDSVMPRFLSGIQRWKIVQQLKWDSVISALVAEFDIHNNVCLSINPIRYII